MIQQLTLDHYSYCMTMIGIKSKCSGTIGPDPNIQKERMQKYFENNDTFYAFGIIEHDLVTSWMTIFFSKSDKKFWGITSFYTNHFSKFFVFDYNGPLIRHVIDFAEQKNYWQFLYVVSERINRVYTVQWKKNHLHQSENYYIHDKDVILANTRPDNDLYWRLLGEETKPHNMIIKHRVHKYNK